MRPALDHRRPATLHAGRLAIVVLAALPYFSLYALHVHARLWRPGLWVPTGFVQYDQAYYGANGRAIFERGNGLAYPNPYDPSPEAPVIYFHWFPWLLGFGITKLGFDPGCLYVALGILGGLACSWMTLRLVETVLPAPPFRRALFLFTMWGGGLLCLAQACISVLRGTAPFDDMLALDPKDGWWFLYWGRNLVFSSEAAYHATMAATWVAALRERTRGVLIGTALLAATHPFSGLQILMMTSCWAIALVATAPSARSLRFAAACLAMLAGFLGYYLVYLPSFPQHVSLEKAWDTGWSHPVSALVLAYGPIGVVALMRLWHDRGAIGRPTYFLIACAVVSLALIEHDLVLPARQPLHFARGYVWMPLCLLALPQFQAWLAQLRARMAAVPWVLFVVLAGCVAVFDNAAFLAGC